MTPPGKAWERYSSSLATVLQSAAVPYGVTLTVWASGASVGHDRGSPKVFEIFLFVLGGMVGYTTLALVVARRLQQLHPGSPGAQMALTGMLHLLSIGAAVGAVMLVAEIDSWVAWPLGGFTGISLYLALVGCEYMLAPLLPVARKAPRR